MNGYVGVCAFPPLRQKKGAKTGHGAFLVDKTWVHSCNASQDDRSFYVVNFGNRTLAGAAMDFGRPNFLKRGIRLRIAGSWVRNVKREPHSGT